MTDYPDLRSIQRILVIKLRHLGDVLLTSSFFSNLKKALPQSTIDAYLYEESIPMLEGHPAISSFHGYCRLWKKYFFAKRLYYEVRLLWQIRRKKYDMVINLTEGDRGAICARISKAKVRVGMDPQESGMKGKKKLYTHLIKHYGSPRHVVEKNLDALRRIGIFPKENERDLFLYLPEKDKEAMRTLLLEKKIAPYSYILIHPTSRWLYKSWPSVHFCKLLSLLLREHLPIILCGGKEEKERHFIEKMKEGISDPLLLDLTGKTTLKEMGVLIEMSRLLLCVDSVSLHMGSALKVKTLALFGPTSEILWGPWQNSNARVLSQSYSCRPCCQDGCAGSKMSDCLFTLSVDRVKKTIDEMLLS